MIIMTKELFNKVEEVDTHKNHKVYYLFAMFTKYVMNNEANAFQYYKKMKQVIGMRKFLGKNFASEGGRDFKVTDEASGLLILDGRTEIFNQVRFANRKLLEMCGLAKESLVG